MSEKKDKLISIIVPVYNIRGYIEKCIQSIIGQTYTNLEILLVDDGSTDDSGKICERFALQDDRITVLHKSNGGLSDARNYAIDRANGDLLAFVDGDDWVHPQMYELMAGIMKRENADIVTCWFEQEDTDFARRRYTTDDLDVRQFTGAEALSDIETPLVVAWNKLYKREIFDDIRYPKGKLHEDEFIIHRIFYKCRKVVVISQALYFYTIRNGSIVAQMTPKRIQDSLEAFTDRVAFADEKGWLEVMPAVVKRYCDYCIDRYNDIRVGRYEMFDDSYLTLLWQSAHDMLDKYNIIEVDEKYRRFAKSPEEYYDWLAKSARRDRYRNIPRTIAHKTAKILRIKKLDK